MTNACPIQSCLPGDLLNRESWFPHQHLDVGTFAKHVPKAIGEGEEGEERGVLEKFCRLTGCQGRSQGSRAAILSLPRES